MSRLGLFKYRLVATTLMLCIVISGITIAVLQQSAHAANGKEFNSGRIIDDAVFYNNGAMSTAQVQAFLNAKVPNCDTNGTLPAADWGYPNITHAKLAEYKRNGTNGFSKDTGFHAPPYTCLKNFKQNTPQMEAASGLCSALPARTNSTAAQIIKDVADACNINPQVLIVLLDKEQSLVTDTWPLQRQYKSATGFACPDTAPCDPSYNGFFYQVYHAARQFNVYRAFPTSYNYIAGRTNNIYWHPDLSRCGSSQVYIQNQATAALYIYTPYRPNQAALNNLYGTGDSCSSYGNRNFWRLFTDWFGSTFGSISVNGISIESQPFLDKSVTASFTIKNNTPSKINLGRLKVAVRSPSNKNADFDQVDNISLNPGQSYTYRKSRAFTGEEGDYRLFIARYDGVQWHYPPFGNFGQESNGEAIRRVTKQPTITEGLSLNTQQAIHNSQLVTASFKVKNNSAYPVNIGIIKAAARDSKDTWLDFPDDGDKTLSPGETYTYQKSRAIEATGIVRTWISNKRTAYNWSDDFPASSASPTVRTISLPITDPAALTAPLVVTSSQTHGTSTVRGTFSIKNFGTKPVEIGYIKPAVRNEKDINYDLPYSPYITLAPGEEYTYDESRDLPPGQYHLWVANKRNDINWSETFPVNKTSGMIRSQTISIKEPVTLVEPLTVTMANPAAGAVAKAAFKIKNFSTTPVEVGVIKPAARDSKNTWLDFPDSPYLTLQPGQEYSYNQSRILPNADTMRIWIANKRNDFNWSENFPASETNGMARNIQYSLQKTVRLTAPLSVSTSGKTISGTFTVKNFGASIVEVGYIKPAVRRSDGYGLDLPYSPYVMLAPGESYTYTGSRAMPTAGSYTVWIANKRNNYNWSETFPVSQDSSMLRKTVVTLN